VAEEWQVSPDADDTAVHRQASARDQIDAPRVLSVSDLLDLDVPAPEMLFEGMPVPMRGASLLVGAAKSGKTLLAIQKAIAVASGVALFGHYRVLNPGPALIVEQDDPAGEASIKAILERCRVHRDLPLYVVPLVSYSFGPKLLEWIESKATELAVRFLVLDSYTSLRGSRGAGVDIVKAEQYELTSLDTLAKKLGSAFEIVHHASKGSAALDWSEKAAGTFAMSAATEAQIHVSRFAELDCAAPERLVRVRGRHSTDVEMVLRLRTETLDYEQVLEGGAASLYPLLLQIQTDFEHNSFGPKELSQAIGVSRATAHRHISALYRAGALQKRAFGEYTLAVRDLFTSKEKG
jgi:hypothetical protein